VKHGQWQADFRLQRLDSKKGGQMKDANYWIDKLELQRHPEGGYFKETYRSHEVISKNALPLRFSGDRVFSTCIYFLLNKNDFSAFHAIKQDELWHFYEGSSLTLHIICQEGDYSSLKLGRDINNGQSLQAVVKAGSLFAAAVDNTELYSLVGCTVAPGFEFTDFEMHDRSKLVELHPEHRQLIERFTYQ
jgi:predicted cupin superfamily sugar epimerase